MEALPGDQLLVGLTYVEADGSLRQRRQLLGEVQPPPVDAPAAVTIRAPGGETLALPADPHAYIPAPRGTYRCLATGEMFTDPDLLASWRIMQSPGAPDRWQPNYAPLVRPPDPAEWELAYRHDPAHLRRFLERHSAAYLGRRVQITLDVYQEAEDSASPTFLGEEQRAGRLARASLGEGTVVVLDNGKEFRLPPDLTLFQPAPPDLLTRWVVYRNPEDAE